MFVTEGDGTMTCHRTCEFCRQPSSVSGLDPAKVALYDNGRGLHIQEVWPELSADDREIIQSGTHGDCFDAAFPDDEPDEDWSDLDSLFEQGDAEGDAEGDEER